MYEKLLQEAYDEDIDVYEKLMPPKLKGLYLDNVIQINCLQGETEKTCVLAEELGHHHTTVGNILDQSKICNRKQENLARAWAFRRLVSFEHLVLAYSFNCRTIEEFADYCEVTVEFFINAINHYKDKYGIMTTYGDGYIIYFEPLGIMKIL